jgi:hypothetical protein
VYQLVMQLIRLTFEKAGEEDTSYPFKYTDSLSTTGIFINSVMDKTSANYGARPTLLVTRGAAMSQSVSMGDTAQWSTNTGIKNGLTLVQSSVDVKAVSKRETEADILGNQVFSFFVSCRTILPALTTVQRIESISLSPVSPYEDDDHMFFTQINLSYSMKYKWDWEITPTLLNEIGLFINDELKVDISKE